MRKFIAMLIVAVVLGTGLTVRADAAPALSQSEQVKVLKAKVKALRADVAFWRDEVAYLDGELSKAQNKPVYPAFASTNTANSATTVYIVSWSAVGVGGTFAWSSNPLYTPAQRDVFVQYLNDDPNTVQGSVSVAERTLS